MKRLLLVMLSLAVMTTTAEAQFLKNLKKKVEEKVERRVSDKISDKAADEADRQLEEMWSSEKVQNTGFSMGADRVSAEAIPDSYSFDWELTMSVEHPQGSMEMHYLMPEDAPYIGMRIQQGAGMLVVQDNRNHLTVMYMTSGQNKMVSATKSDIENAEVENPYEELEMKKVGTKNILGYECQGYQMENDKYLITYYVTDELDLSFNQMQYASNQENMPKGFNPEWFEEGGMMMQMEMHDKSDGNRSMRMTCTNIEKKNLSIHTADYQSF